MFNINYTKIKFNISFTKECKLYRNKNSALRGILGHSLIDCNCILKDEDRNCNTCRFNNRCIAANIMNLKTNKSGKKMGDNGIAPFIIDCSNKATLFEEYDELEFTITIFGDSIVLTPYIIYAYQFAGATRGLVNTNFYINSVESITGESIFDGKRLIKENIKILNLNDYIKERSAQISEIREIRLITPLRFKKDNKLSENVEFIDIINLINRRMSTLKELEDNEFKKIDYSNKVNIDFINIKWKEQERYSNRQKQHMSLGGIVGSITFENIPQIYKELIIAGELIHIGKSTSLGLGKYIIK